MLKPFLLFITLSFLIIVSGCSQKDQAPQTELKQDTIEINTSPEITALNKKLVEDPNDDELYYQRAKEYIKIRDLNTALEDINRALGIDSSVAKYFSTRGEIRFMKRDVPGAKKDYLRSINLDPEYIEGLLKLAEIHFYLSDHLEAHKLISRAIKVNQQNPKAYFLKGMVYKDQKDTAHAIESMQNVIEIDPDYYNAYMQLGVMMIARKNPLAEGYLKNAIRINPKSVEALYALGLFYQEAGKYNEALETYTNLLNVDPKNPYAYYNMGYIHYQYLKVYDIARKNFDTAVQLKPDYAEAIYMRGLSNESLGDVKKAEEDYRLALKVKPNYEKPIKGLNRLGF